MKIIKLPYKTNRISCDCGCEFEFGLEDVKVDLIAVPSYDTPKMRYIKSLFINCPLCGYETKLKPDLEDEDE